MVSTKDDVKKEAEVLYKMQHTFTHVGFVERIVAIAETYAQQRLLQQTPCSTLRELYAQKLSEAEQMVATTPFRELNLTEKNKQLVAIETVLQMMGEPPPVA